MFIESGLIALAMLGLDAPPASKAPAPTALSTSSFELKVITVEGLGWRSTAYPRLVPVARQGSSTVWTADKALAKSLEAACQGEAAAARASLSGESSEGNSGQIYFISHVNRFADGPINQATAVAYTPEVASFEEGVKATVNGRKMDQGVLATVQIEDHHLEAVHTVSLSETVPSYVVAGAVVRSGDQKIATTVQVPEVSHASVSGEWLIPNDGVILISLGVHTAADVKGKAVVRERLAILEVQSPSAMPPPTIAPGNLSNYYPVIHDRENGTSVSFEPIPEGVSRSIPPVSVASLVTPTMPSRSMPEAVDPSGKVVDLPPLPEGYASADLNRIQPDQPSPQSQVAAKGVDDGLAQVSFIPVPTDKPVPRLASGDPISFVPLNCFVRKLQKLGGFEGYGLMVSSQEAGEPQGAWVQIFQAPKCDDKECQAEAAEAEKVIKGSASNRPTPPPVVSPAPPRPVGPGEVAIPLPQGGPAQDVNGVASEPSFFPTIEEAQRLPVQVVPLPSNKLEFLREKVMISAAVAGFDVEVSPGRNGDTMTVTFKKAETCDEACEAEAKKSADAPAKPHCENGADCEMLSASKLQKMGGPTGAEAVFVKFLETMQAIEPELSPLGELIAEKAVLKVVGVMNKLGFPIEVETDEKDVPKPAEDKAVVVADCPALATVAQPAMPSLLKALIGDGIKVEIKIEPANSKLTAGMPMELPSGKYMNDDVQYFAPPKVDESAKKTADEAPKTIPCPAEPAGMTGLTAHRLAMAELIKATIAMGAGVEMKCNPADNPAFCKFLEAMHPGSKPGESLDFDIVSGPRPDATPASLGFSVNVKNPDGMCILDAEMNLTPALTTPGKTQKVMLPLANNLALEVQATVVPAPKKP